MADPGLILSARTKYGRRALSYTYLVLPSHLRGSVTIADAATSSAVTLELVQPNATYVVLASIVGVAGAPAAGSLRPPYVTSRATTGFTLNTEAAPGAGTSVTIDWILVPNNGSGNGMLWSYRHYSAFPLGMFYDFLWPSIQYGTITIADTDTSGSVTLARPLQSNAHVYHTLIATSGAPATNSRRVRTAAAGTTVQLDVLAAPGAGTSVTFAYLAVKPYGEQTTGRYGILPRSMYWPRSSFVEFEEIQWPVTLIGVSSFPYISIGSATAGGSPQSIAFTQNLPASSYKLLISCQSAAVTEPTGSEAVYATSKAVTGFTANQVTVGDSMTAAAMVFPV